MHVFPCVPVVCTHTHRHVQTRQCGRSQCGLRASDLKVAEEETGDALCKGRVTPPEMLTFQRKSRRAGLGSPPLHSPPPYPLRRNGNKCLEGGQEQSKLSGGGCGLFRGENRGGEEKEGGRRWTDTSRPEGLGHKEEGRGQWGHSRQHSPLRHGPGFA